MVKMKLKGPIPQYLPLSCRKLRIWCLGFKTVCTNYYGLHARQKCRNEKVLWIKYVENFMKLNSEIEREQYVDGAVVYKWQN